MAFKDVVLWLTGAFLIFMFVVITDHVKSEIRYHHKGQLVSLTSQKAVFDVNGVPREINMNRCDFPFVDKIGEVFAVKEIRQQRENFFLVYQNDSWILDENVILCGPVFGR